MTQPGESDSTFDELRGRRVDHERAWARYNEASNELDAPRRAADAAQGALMDEALRLFLGGATPAAIAEALGYGEGYSATDALAQQLAQYITARVRNAAR
jgi:ferric-dicitrate binding protein FerR (iron transport regulator)